MAFALRSHEDILRDILNGLRGTGISYLPQGSKARAIAASMAREIDTAYRFFDSNFDKAYLNAASNELLEALGTLFGVSRKQPRKAYSISAEQNVTFYAEDDQTFGAINGGAGIPIPAGTIIETISQVSDVEPLQYQLVNNLTLSPGDTVGFATVEALAEGASSNVGPNTLRAHDFTSYVGSGAGSLKVTNRFAIVNGTDRETDAFLRARIALAAVALQRGNLTSLRFAALSVPGVIDVRILRYHDGIGSVGVFVTGQDNEAPPALVSEVQLALTGWGSAGEVVTAYSPEQVGIALETKVNLSREVTVNEQNEIEQKLLDAARSFFSDLSIGEAASLSVLLRDLLATDTLIVNFGTTPSDASFDKLYMYRYSDASEERVRSELLNTLTSIEVEDHEILITETSIATPLSFSFEPIA